MRAIQRMLLRDTWHLRGQLAAIAVVVACGVAAVVTSRTAYESLVVSQDSYYTHYRFAHAFAQLKRAPETLRARIESIPGVAAVQTRVVAEVTLDVPGLSEPATGRLVSIPERGPSTLNLVHLRQGRRPEPGHPDEVLVSEAFADANRLSPGATLGAVLNGRWERLRIVGVVLSPEYIYEIRGTDVFPDNKRFGVVWISRAAMGPAFEMDGAYNDVSLRLAPDAVEEEVIARLDGLLERYGGLGAYGRDDHISHRFISDEIRQNQVFGTAMPAIYLSVAAFLLNIVLSRLVSTQRDQIAVLKAFGYGSLDVALHYLGFALTAVTAGAALGTALGLWLGAELNQLYGDFYRFPLLRYEPGASVVLLAVGVAGAAAFLGALGAVRRVLALAPAEAMRPEPPKGFRKGMLERLGLRRLLPASALMIWRNVARQPLRAALSVTGMAFAVAILVVGHYFIDAIEHIAEVQFRTVQREDITLAFHEPLRADARHAVAALPGVLQSEPFRVVPARLRFEHASRRVPLFGLAAETELRRIVDTDRRVWRIPHQGVLLTAKLGEILGVKPGDRLRVEVLEGSRPVREVEVAGLVDELIGLMAYMDEDALGRLMREDATVSGAFLRVEAPLRQILHQELKRMPAVAGTASRLATLASFEATLAQSMGIFTNVLVIFASVIAAAVVYNAARIALSERARELASLRVLGFSRREVGVLLFGEQALLTLLAIPLGFGIGWLLCAGIASAYQWELFRLPLFISGRTWSFSVLVLLGSAFASALVVRRRIHRLDLVAVLKTRE
jgi:putative ABC transport system permease protein